MKLLLPSVTKTPSAWSGRAGWCQPEQLQLPGQLQQPDLEQLLAATDGDPLQLPGQLLQLDLEQLLAATDGDPLRLPQLLPRQP